jgi:signal transduction histidine kinase
VTNVENCDELSSLAHLFNDLMNQLEISFYKQKQFVEDASHELRTPVTIMEGHLNLLLRWGKSDPAVLEESLQASLQEVRRLKGLVHELLTLSKMENKPVMDSGHHIEVTPFIQETLQRLGVLHPDFVFETQIAEIEHVLIRMNPLHLEQVLLIVLDNAVKYSHLNKIVSLHATIVRQSVQITIEDHGIGIPEEDVPYVFDRFYRVDKSRNRALAGTGLGLSIARQIVLAYKGEIWISSQEHMGTKVGFRLPIFDSDARD